MQSRVAGEQQALPERCCQQCAGTGGTLPNAAARPHGEGGRAPCCRTEPGALPSTKSRRWFRTMSSLLCCICDGPCCPVHEGVSDLLRNISPGRAAGFFRNRLWAPTTTQTMEWGRGRRATHTSPELPHIPCSPQPVSGLRFPPHDDVCQSYTL